MNVYVLNIARELAATGVKVDVYTRATRPSQGDVVQVCENLRVINIVAGPYEGLAKEELPTQLAAFAGGIVQFTREEGLEYDLFHSHYWLSGQVGWLLRDLVRVPLIHTGHTWAAVKNAARLGVGSADDADSPETEARRICEQQLVDNAEVLVVNTPDEITQLGRHYDADPARIRVVTPGADTRMFTPGTNRNTEVARRHLGIPLDSKVIAFVGRLQEFKGPQVLIRAVAELLERDPDSNVRAIICGGASGSDVSVGYYRAMAHKLGVGRKIRFLGPRPPEELVQIYQAADVVAVPSYNESFGLVAIEAQATGTPVVAARAGGLPLAVSDGETGVLVDGHDPVDWADALEQLLIDDTGRITMAEAAVERAAQFSWAASAAALFQVYGEAVEGFEPTPRRRAVGN